MEDKQAPNPLGALIIQRILEIALMAAGIYIGVERMAGALLLGAGAGSLGVSLLTRFLRK